MAAEAGAVLRQVAGAGRQRIEPKIATLEQRFILLQGNIMRELAELREIHLEQTTPGEPLVEPITPPAPTPAETMPVAVGETSPPTWQPLELEELREGLREFRERLHAEVPGLREQAEEAVYRALGTVPLGRFDR